MKNYLLAFVLSFSVYAVQAQIQAPHLHRNSDYIFNWDPYYSGSVNSDLINYTDNGTSGVYNNTDITGTTTSVSWAISGSTISYEVTISAPTGNSINDYSLYIVDDFQNDHPTYCDTYEESLTGRTYVHFSGTGDLGNVQRDLFFYFNYTVNTPGSALGASSGSILAAIHYRQPVNEY